MERAIRGVGGNTFHCTTTYKFLIEMLDNREQYSFARQSSTLAMRVVMNTKSYVITISIRVIIKIIKKTLDIYLKICYNILLCII